MHSTSFSCILLATFAAALLPPTARAQQAPATSQPAAPNLNPTLTLDDIFRAADAERAKIHDLTVSYSFNATHSQADDPVFRDHVQIAVKGSFMRMEEQYGANPAGGGKLFTRDYSYDGKISVVWIKNQRAAIYSKTRSEECSLYSLGFFINGLLAPPPNDDKNFYGPWLPSLLKRSDARILDKLQVIDGSPCYVVELGHPGQGGGLSQKLWLDPSQGFMPLQVFTFSNGAHEPDIETYVDKTVQIIPGVWLPLHGRRVDNTEFTDLKTGGLDSKPHPSMSEYILAVDGWDKGNPDIHVNSEIKDAYFDLRPDLPAKTLLIDRDAQKK